MQLIAWKDSSPNYLLCVEWDVKPYTLTHLLQNHTTLPYDITHVTLCMLLVATLPWDLGNKKFKSSADIKRMCKTMQKNCMFIASNFVIHPQISIFSVFKIASCSPYWLLITFSMSLFFYLLTFVINCGTGNSSQHTPLQCVSTINMVFSG